MLRSERFGITIKSRNIKKFLIVSIFAIFLTSCYLSIEKKESDAILNKNDTSLDITLHEKYLPLGSIVRLEGGDPVLIYGRKQISIKNGEEYDYLACFYPQGYIDYNNVFLFNHDSIVEIISLGYSDSRDLAYIERLKKNKIN